jgi:hypothetical protein
VPFPQQRRHLLNRPIHGRRPDGLHHQVAYGARVSFVGAEDLLHGGGDRQEDDIVLVLTAAWRVFSNNT